MSWGSHKCIDWDTLIHKELAFDIIKKKKVDIVNTLLFAFKEDNGCEFYNSYMHTDDTKLTPFEYRILKEAFYETNK